MPGGRTRAPPAASAREPQRWIRIVAVAATVWLGGAVLSLAMLLVGLRRLGRVAVAARRIETGCWADVSAQACRAIGLRRPIALLQSDHPRLLVTWGIARPKIVLPMGAERWTLDRKR